MTRYHATAQGNVLFTSNSGTFSFNLSGGCVNSGTSALTGFQLLPGADLTSIFPVYGLQHAI